MVSVSADGSAIGTQWSCVRSDSMEVIAQCPAYDLRRPPAVEYLELQASVSVFRAESSQYKGSDYCEDMLESAISSSTVR
jgi:hypothetical protein